MEGIKTQQFISKYPKQLEGGQGQWDFSKILSKNWKKNCQLKMFPWKVFSIAWFY
jgi:hypothetical protein